MVLESHVTNKNYYFLITSVPIATKLDMMVAHLDGLLPTKFHNPLSRDLATSRDKLKPLYLHYDSAYGHETW